MRPYIRKTSKFIVLAFIISCCLLFCSCTSTFGSPQLFTREATNADIVVDGDLDLGNLGVKYILKPNVDIEGLTIKINLLDKNYNKIESFTKYIGNVQEGVQVNVSLSLTEMSLSAIFKVKYESIKVVGGRVSYFA